MSVAGELAGLAADVAREAGRIAAAGRASVARVQDVVTDAKSTATDMVTEFDRATEALVVERIRTARPDDGLVGEEGAEIAGTTGIDWVIDPIDGTTNFLYGLPGWAVSVAARDAVGGLAGAVYVPALDELFVAARGEGATLDGTPLRCSAVTDPALALVATGFAYRADRRAWQGARVARLLPRVRDIRRMGAASVDLCYVAAGRIDAYFEDGLGPWDWAAGELIAREAGCTSSDYSGDAPSSAGIVVANPALHAALRSLVVEATDPLPD